MVFSIRRRCLLLSISASALAGCGAEPDAADRTSREIVATGYDVALDFRSFESFAVAPVMSLLTSSSDGRASAVTDGEDIAARIGANLESRGYRQVEKSEHPDLGVNLSALCAGDGSGVPTGAWWSAPGYATPPEYWGYSGSYFAPFSYTSMAYQSGTLVVEIVDLKDADGRGGGTPPAIAVAWAAFAHGYVERDGDLLADAPAAIDQAFLQSPYLTRE